MSSELKPCPFCGSEAEIETPSVIAAVFCNRCSAAVVSDTAKEAINAWNQRAERTCHLELTSWDDSHGTQHDFLGCSNCGEFASTPDQYGPNDGPFYCSNCGSSIDHSFITDYASGDVIWTASDGNLGDLSDDKNWRGTKVVE